MKRLSKLALAGAAVALPVLAQAQSQVTDITSAASSTFTTVAGICVTMGVFFIGYRIAKRIR